MGVQLNVCYHERTGSAKCSGQIEKQKGHLTWQQHTPPATAALDLKECFSVSERVTPHGDRNMKLLFQKKLTKSDVSNKRMVLPKVCNGLLILQLYII